MLDVLSEDYIRTARAKGVATRPVLLKHALKNAGVPIVTVIGIGVALLIGGVVITETVFNIPGVGRLVVDAIQRRDYPIIQGVTLLFSGVYVLVNLLVDLTLHADRSEDPILMVDPRHRSRLRRAGSRGRARIALRAAQPDARHRRRPARPRASLIAHLRAAASRATRVHEAGRTGSRRPAASIWFGTDHLGRDVYARTIYGARVSLAVGFIGGERSRSAIGLALGLLAGYFRRFDAVIMRLMDGLMAIPAMLLAIALVSLGQGQRRHRDHRHHHPRNAARGAPRALGRADGARAPYVEAAVAGGTRTLRKILCATSCLRPSRR